MKLETILNNNDMKKHCDLTKTKGVLSHPCGVLGHPKSVLVGFTMFVNCDNFPEILLFL